MNHLNGRQSDYNRTTILNGSLKIDEKLLSNIHWRFTVNFHVETAKTNFTVFVLAGIELLIFHINGNEGILE
jgi:hypothetical protein